jgi:hypothetical protein
MGAVDPAGLGALGVETAPPCHGGSLARGSGGAAAPAHRGPRTTLRWLLRVWRQQRRWREGWGGATTPLHAARVSARLAGTPTVPARLQQQALAQLASAPPW